MGPPREGQCARQGTAAAHQQREHQHDEVGADKPLRDDCGDNRTLRRWANGIKVDDYVRAAVDHFGCEQEEHREQSEALWLSLSHCVCAVQRLLPRADLRRQDRLRQSGRRARAHTERERKRERERERAYGELGEQQQAGEAAVEHAVRHCHSAATAVRRTAALQARGGHPHTARHRL